MSGSIEFQERPEGGRLFALLVQGDMIVFPRLDRAFRNTLVLCIWLLPSKDESSTNHLADASMALNKASLSSTRSSIKKILLTAT